MKPTAFLRRWLLGLGNCRDDYEELRSRLILAIGDLEILLSRGFSGEMDRERYRACWYDLAVFLRAQRNCGTFADPCEQISKCFNEPHLPAKVVIDQARPSILELHRLAEEWAVSLPPCRIFEEHLIVNVQESRRG